MGEWPNDGRLSARHIRLACEDSLRRLQTDHIDLYQMHHVDRTAPWEEIWQAMDTLSSRARSSTSAAATSPAGTSSERTKPLPAGTRSAWSASRASTTSWCGPSNSRCYRRVASTASA